MVSKFPEWSFNYMWCWTYPILSWGHYFRNPWSDDSWQEIECLWIFQWMNTCYFSPTFEHAIVFYKLMPILLAVDQKNEIVCSSYSFPSPQPPSIQLLFRNWWIIVPVCTISLLLSRFDYYLLFNMRKCHAGKIFVSNEDVSTETTTILQAFI